MRFSKYPAVKQSRVVSPTSAFSFVFTCPQLFYFIRKRIFYDAFTPENADGNNSKWRFFGTFSSSSKLETERFQTNHAFSKVSSFETVFGHFSVDDWWKRMKKYVFPYESALVWSGPMSVTPIFSRISDRKKRRKNCKNLWVRKFVKLLNCYFYSLVWNKFIKYRPE